MPTVLVFGEFGSLNGGENSFLATVPYLNDNGWDVFAAVPSDSDFSEALELAGVTVFPFWLTGLGGDRLSQDQIRSAMANIISETRPDVVHANSLSTSRLLGPVRNEVNIPCSGHLRDIIKCSAKAIQDINGLDRIIAVSKATANHHCSFGLDQTKVRVVYNGVDNEQFTPLATRSIFNDSPSPIRKQMGLETDSFLALCVGQIGMRKGVECVLQAMKGPIESYNNVHLLMVGERHSQKQEAIEYEEDCRQLASSINSERIHWLGRRPDIASLMQQSDLLIHMPRQEPLGRVLLEAASSGLPIVTTDVGGTREILIDLEELIVPQTDNFEDCFDFDKFYRDTEYHHQIGKRLRKLAVDRFPFALAGKNLSDQWTELIQDNSE